MFGFSLTFLIGIDQPHDLFTVGLADILPHNRRGGSDSGQIFKSPAAIVFIVSSASSDFLTRVDETVCDDVRQMADGACGIIV